MHEKLIRHYIGEANEHRTQTKGILLDEFSVCHYFSDMQEIKFSFQAVSRNMIKTHLPWSLAALITSYNSND